MIVDTRFITDIHVLCSVIQELLQEYFQLKVGRKISRVSRLGMKNLHSYSTVLSYDAAMLAPEGRGWILNFYSEDRFGCRSHCLVRLTRAGFPSSLVDNEVVIL